MGSSLNRALKTNKESVREMYTDENCIVTEETDQQTLKTNIQPSEMILTEDNYQNMTEQKTSKPNEERIYKSVFKKYDKSSEDLKFLSHQLHKYLRQVWKSQKISYYLFDLPSEFQNKLEADAKELESIYLQIMATSKNIETIKEQHKAIQNEQHEMKATLLKKTEKEKQEMEMIVSIYDEAMYGRWEAIKSCQSETVVENFLIDVEGKIQAMKHLKTLVHEKLFEIKNKNIIKANKENNLNKKESKNKKNSGAKGEVKRHLKRSERVDYLADDHAWDTVINSEHSSMASFYLSHTSSVDSFLESHSSIHVEMESVLQALFGEQIPVGSNILGDTANSTNPVNID